MSAPSSPEETGYGQNYQQSGSPVEGSSAAQPCRMLVAPPPPTEGLVQCYVKRTKHFSSTLYELFLKEDETLLATVQKSSAEKCYAIRAAGVWGRGGAGAQGRLLGKLKCDLWSSSEFKLVDGGANCKKLSVWDDERDELDVGEVQPRRELAKIKWASSDTGARSLQVSLGSGAPLVNKAPKWSEEKKRNVLDFEGRVTMGSCKNFQLAVEGSDQPVMQFGRVGKDAFNLDYAAPLNGLQAFGIALSVFGWRVV